MLIFAWPEQDFRLMNAGLCNMTKWRKIRSCIKIMHDCQPTILLIFSQVKVGKTTPTSCDCRTDGAATTARLLPGFLFYWVSHIKSFPHHPHHRRPSPHATPHPAHPISAGTTMAPNVKGMEKDAPRWVPLPAHPANRLQLPHHPGQWAPPRTVNAMKTALTHHPTSWVPVRWRPTDANTNANRHKKTAKTTLNTETSARTTPANVGSPPHLKPCPSPCHCRGMWVYRKRRSRNTEPIRRTLYPRPTTRERRRLDTPTNQLTTNDRATTDGEDLAGTH